MKIARGLTNSNPDPHFRVFKNRDPKIARIVLKFLEVCKLCAET
jgi:hypothetical protein